MSQSNINILQADGGGMRGLISMVMYDEIITQLGFDPIDKFTKYSSLLAFKNIHLDS